MRIVIDAELCSGHGRCYTLVPELFEADDEGHGLVKVHEVPPGGEEQVHRAIVNCPEQAISIVD